MAAKRLLELSKEEQLAFLDSFDTVFSDVDGCLWEIGHSIIEGADEGINALRKLGKKLYLVTNNSTNPMDLYLSRLSKFNVVKEEVVRPANAIIWYLKKINFQKEVYVVGFQALKDEIKAAGFKVVYEEVAPIGETAQELLQKLRELRPDVGAVVLDVAVNMTYMGLQQCVEYITKNNAIFLTGSYDPEIPLRGSKLIGCPYFIKAVEEISGKPPIILSKPSKAYNEYLIDVLGPSHDPKRILFIGDSSVSDMPFATACGYRKLLPLSGQTTEQDLQNWKYDQKIKPDYVVDNIKALGILVKNLGLDK